MKVDPGLYEVTITDSFYGTDKKVFDKAQEKFIGLDFLALGKFDDESQFSSKLFDHDGESIVINKDQIVELSLRGIDFKVKRKIEVLVDITQQIIDIAERPIKLIQETGNRTEYNTKCEVHMPGNAMALYNEMLLLTDVCTDELQSSLNSGWRLVAVCPQPEQRRPDYILGRFNPDYDAGGSATR